MQIKFEDVFYTYNKKSPLESKAIHDINLTLLKDQFTAIIGKTGSGKSTLTQHMNGLLIPQSGRVIIGDYNIDSDKKKRSKNYKNIRKDIGLVFQFPEYQLFEETVRKDIAFGPKNFGFSEEEINEKILCAIKLVGLDESFLDRSPFELSGGEKRRVALAGIVACQPKILVVDEPTAGLDPQGSKEVMNMLSDLHKAGISIVMVTHDMEAVVRYCDRVVLMDEGKIIFDGTPIELFKNDSMSQYVDTPPTIKFAKYLINKGLKIDLSKVTSSGSLADEIVRAKNE